MIAKQEFHRARRQEGFSGMEAKALRAQYLMVAAMGVPDEDIIYTHEHGLLVNEHGGEIMAQSEGRKFALDIVNDRVFEVPDA